MNKLSRLMYQAPSTFLNPLAQIFFFISLVDGIAFTFFSTSAAVKTIGFTTLAPQVAVPFGIMLLIVALLNLFLLITKHFYFGTAAAMLGFVVWFYAVVLYALGGLWLAMLVHPLPQVAFWAWYFFAVKRYREV